VTTLLELLLAPALVALATLAARRWNEGVGGLVSAFPAIVGPTLLIAADQHGAAFAARAATGTLLGLVGLSAFALAFGLLARGGAWPVALAGGWAAAAVTTALAAGTTPSLPVALAAAVGSLAVAWATLPATPILARAPEAGGVLARMVVTLVLVAALSAAASRFGAFAGGVLAALPVLASVLAVATLRSRGPVAAIGLLRGMLAGMGSFVAFCAVIALLGGVAAAFALALLAAVAAQALAGSVLVLRADVHGDRGA
jgi:hypothetical protein